MRDNEIIKALECCTDCNCKECPCCRIIDGGIHCTEIDEEEILDLINRQKAEIERLKHRKTELQIRNQELQHEKSEAIKAFAHLVIDRSRNGVIYASDIPDLVKEMTECER